MKLHTGKLEFVISFVRSFVNRALLESIHTAIHTITHRYEAQVMVKKHDNFNSNTRH